MEKDPILQLAQDKIKNQWSQGILGFRQRDLKSSHKMKIKNFSKKKTYQIKNR